MCGFITVLLIQNSTVKSSEYLSYQSFYFVNSGHQLISQFSEYQYNQYYTRVNQKRFWGWHTYTVTKSQPVRFVKETLLMIENQGNTSIDQTYYFKTTQQLKQQISASGNINIGAEGSVYEFDLGLKKALDFSAKFDLSSTIEEHNEIRIKVDPMTRLIVKVYGEGNITNGVGKHYRFFIENRRGGWEIFTLTTEYYSIVKERLDGYES